MREAQRSLVELGLSEKEASVYLALLEIGRASVKQIAKKSVVNRTTAYEILEALSTRGVVSRSEEKGKVAYIAESPTRFEVVLRKEEQSLKQKKEHLQEAMPQLFALYNAMEDKPGVRFFEGEEGIATAREAMTSAGGEMLSFCAYDEGLLRLAQIAEEQRIRATKRTHGRIVFAMKPGVPVRSLDTKNWEIRQLPYESYPFTGEVNIGKGKIGAFVFRTKPIAFILESHEMADLFRVLFEMAWITAKPVDKKKFIQK
jgi:sugar-specific transcriptional regulator TrmB